MRSATGRLALSSRSRCWSLALQRRGSSPQIPRETYRHRQLGCAMISDLGSSRPILQVRDDSLRELPGSRAAAEVLCTGLGVLEGRLYSCLHPVGLLAVAYVDEHVLGREQRRERVCPVLSSVLRG